MSSIGRDSLLNVPEDEKYRQQLKSIERNCGRRFLALLRSGHSWLTPAVIGKLSRSSPERQQFEIEQVHQGRRPFSIKTTVFDTNDYGEVESRLGRAGGAINRTAQFVRRLQTERRLAKDEIPALLTSVGDLLHNCGKLNVFVRDAYRMTLKSNGAIERKGYVWSEPKDWGGMPLLEVGLRQVRSDLHRAASWVEKCVRDVPQIVQRVPAENQRPSRGQAHSIGIKLFEMIRQMLRLRETLLGHPAANVVRVATHAKPDVDALAALWLAERYLFPGPVEVVFLTYDHKWEKGPVVDCVLDMGNLHDPRLNLFDHKEPARAKRGETCATGLVWEHLHSLGKRVDHLRPLVEAVHGGDAVALRATSTAYRESKRNGLHAFFVKARSRSDHDRLLYRAICGWLDERFQ